MNFMEKICRRMAAWLGRHNPKLLVHIRYFARFHKPLRLRHPRNLNEKILHLSLMTDTMRWTELADKYRVRKYIEDCGYKDSLPELYGVWNDACDIDFDALPESFVMKTNHGCGDVRIVHDKALINKMELTEYFNRQLKTPYGEREAGLHYMRIRPCIIAEQLLVTPTSLQKYSKSMIDYKMWCFNGRCQYILVICNRDKHGAELLLYDKEWVCHPEYSVFTGHYRKGYKIPKPLNLNQMIAMAETLSKPFPCVRVDLYNIDGKIYFGEMTFTSLGGMMNYFTDEFLDKAGDMVDLNYPG